MGKRRIRPLGLGAGVLAAVATMLVVLAPASAAPRATCTKGDAQALVEALPVAVAQWRRGQDHPGLLESFHTCQYRLFWDGQTFTYHESDYFVGGIASLWDYKASGISRGEAIADLGLYEDRVWLAEKHADGSIGELREQALTCTAWKDVNDPIFGLTVYRQCAFIGHLPVGEYVSYWETTYLGLPVGSATVNLVILPG